MKVEENMGMGERDAARALTVKMNTKTNVAEHQLRTRQRWSMTRCPLIHCMRVQAAGTVDLALNRRDGDTVAKRTGMQMTMS